MNKRTVILIVTVVAVIIGLFILRRLQLLRAEVASEYETVAVRRDTIVATVNSSGNVLPRRQVALAFPSGGVIAELAVETGQRIEAGQELARLDTRQLQQGVVQAEATLKSAEARLSQVKAGPSAAEVAAAQASLDSAQAQYEAARSQLNLKDEQLTIAEADLKRAELAVKDAQAAYDLVGWRSDIGRLPQSGALEKATVDYQRALSNYRLQVAGIDDTAFKSAAAQLAQAKSQLEKLQQMPTAEDVTIAEAEVERSEAALEQARLRLADAILVAPLAATVVSVDAEVGEWVGASLPVIALADLDHYYVDTSVDETDIGRVMVGQDADIALDAFPDAKLQGKVTEVDPLGTVSQGVVSYAVKVEIVSSEMPLRPNMTAITNIIVARDEGVLVVLNRAIRRDSSGRLYVEVLSKGEVQRRWVTTALSNDLVTEVLSGLTEGDEAIVSAPRGNILEEVGGSSFGFGGRR